MSQIDKQMIEELTRKLDNTQDAVSGINNLVLVLILLLIRKKVLTLQDSLAYLEYAEANIPEPSKPAIFAICEFLKKIPEDSPLLN